MNKIVYYTLIILTLVSCQLENDSRLHTSQISTSINQSKNNQVFIVGYDFYPNTVFIENKKYKIKEIWAENVWIYKDPKNAEGKWFYIRTKTEDLTIEKYKEKQIVFVFDPQLTEMNLGVSKDSSDEEQCCTNYGYSNNILKISITEEEAAKDTFVLYLFEDSHDLNKKNKFITELRLVKKK